MNAYAWKDKMDAEAVLMGSLVLLFLIVRPIVLYAEVNMLTIFFSYLSV